MCDLGETYAKKELERIAAVHKRGGRLRRPISG